MKTKKRLKILFLIIVLFAVIFSIDKLFIKESETPSINTKTSLFGIIPRQESEAAMYDSLHDNSKVPMPSSKKSTRHGKDYYKIRAYEGAPPRIPHSVDEVIKDGGFENCLQCHKNGSYSVKMKAYAPIAPHPTFKNCRQCHVPKKTKNLFKPTNWKKVKTLKKGRRHLPGSPPVIPHSLQLRENCMSCHFGNGAVEEIKVSHPERTNCRQCHVETNETETFSRDKK